MSYKKSVTNSAALSELQNSAVIAEHAIIISNEQFVQLLQNIMTKPAAADSVYSNAAKAESISSIGTPEHPSVDLGRTEAHWTFFLDSIQFNSTYLL